MAAARADPKGPNRCPPAGPEQNDSLIHLRQEQVDERDLPVIVKPDRRYKPTRHHEAIEVESLGQATVTELIRAELDALLPEPLADVLEREEDQREVELVRLRRGR